jgi:putative transposase
MPDNKWARLAYVTGMVNQTLLLQNEYLTAENRTLRAHLHARIRLSDPERSTLAEIGKRLGRAALRQVACVARPDTILAWYRRLIASKFDGSKLPTSPGRPRIAPELDHRSLIIYTITISSILYFQRNTTGAALISSKY